MIRIGLRIIGKKKNKTYNIVKFNSNINGKNTKFIGHFNNNSSNIKKIYFKLIKLAFEYKKNLKYIFKSCKKNLWKY